MAAADGMLAFDMMIVAEDEMYWSPLKVAGRLMVKRRSFENDQCDSVSDCSWMRDGKGAVDGPCGLDTGDSF
jgi:hypothetical protein